LMGIRGCNEALTIRLSPPSAEMVAEVSAEAQEGEK